MTISATWRRAATMLAAGAVAILLSGCVVTSTETLVTPDEAETDVLPATFTMTTYNEKDGVFVKSEEAPGEFTLKDGGYVAPDGSLTAYFIGIEHPDYYLLATVASDGAMYGAAAIGGDGIMEIRMVIEGDPATFAADLPATITIEGGGILVASREDLEAVFRAIASGKLPTTPLVAYVGTGTPPATIVKDGSWYKAQ